MSSPDCAGLSIFGLLLLPYFLNFLGLLRGDCSCTEHINTSVCVSLSVVRGISWPALLKINSFKNTNTSFHLHSYPPWMSVFKELHHLSRQVTVWSSDKKWEHLFLHGVNFLIVETFPQQIAQLPVACVWLLLEG